MNAYYKGQPVFGPRGPAGPDGNPIGTVISFMGASAPADYLICDGAQYSISQYPALSSFFEAQFGTKNHFGGNGITTFAVPDMRNLFLRGYHGEAEEQLSGGIGEKQEATEHVNLEAVGGTTYAIFTPRDTTAESHMVKNADALRSFATHFGYTGESAYLYPGEHPRYYTARPVNMAVLYCIKAVESTAGGNSAGEVYSTEETRVGTWIDGKPLYQITKTGTFSSESLNAYAPPIGFVFSEIIDPPVYLNFLVYNDTSVLSGEQGSIESVAWNIPNNRIEAYLTAPTYVGSTIICTIRYTKSTN